MAQRPRRVTCYCPFFCFGGRSVWIATFRRHKALVNEQNRQQARPIPPLHEPEEHQQVHVADDVLGGVVVDDMAKEKVLDEVVPDMVQDVANDLANDYEND
jgi:hypothetical protein